MKKLKRRGSTGRSAVPVKHHALPKMFAERTRAGEPAACVLTEMLQNDSARACSIHPGAARLAGLAPLVDLALVAGRVDSPPLPHSRSHGAALLDRAGDRALIDRAKDEFDITGLGVSVSSPAAWASDKERCMARRASRLVLTIATRNR